MTFPTETISFRDTRATLHTSVKNALADTGEFYGLMTVAAAHKSTVTGNIVTPSAYNYQVFTDSNYYVMKEKCLQVLNKNLRNPSEALDHIAMQTVIHLITSSVRLLCIPALSALFTDYMQLIFGFNDEANTHLTGLKRMVELCGGMSSRVLRDSGLIHAIVW